MRTASGSVKVADFRAKVAKASRIWVEGKHDAELVEKVWGEDLRVEGIVVEPLRGIDDLTAAVAAFSPGPNRRLGIRGVAQRERGSLSGSRVLQQHLRIHCHDIGPDFV